MIDLFVEKMHTKWDLKIFSKNDAIKQGLFFIIP